MFNETRCVLCLKELNSADNGIRFDSNDQQSENAREVVEQYFKEELVMLPHITTKIVCLQCWDRVQSFHEFYIKVKNSHLTAMKKLNSLHELEIAVTEIKAEPDAIDNLAIAPCIKTEAIIDKSIDSKNLTQLSNNESSQSHNFDTDFKSEDEGKKIKTNRKSKTKNQTKQKRHSNSQNETIDYDGFIAQYFKLDCILCREPLKTFKELKGHFKLHHQADGYVKCCGKKLYKRVLLVDHIHTHNNPEYFKCQHCQKVASDRSSLDTHLRNYHDSKEPTIFNCDICSKNFFRRKVLARHVLIHVPEEEKDVKCTQCEKKFCNKYEMKQHLALVHLNSYARICDVCGKSLRGAEAFQRHQDEHAGISRPPMKCKLCNAELKTKYGLARHMKSMHTVEGQTPQVCPICSKTSPSVQAHKSHMKSVHTEKKHICKLCDKAFKRARHLREHMTTHTGEVLYTCTFCAQTFNSNANMYAHRKRKHPKEWADKFGRKNTSAGMAQEIQNDFASIVESVNAVEVKAANVE